MTKVIDGKKIAADIREELAIEITRALAGSVSGPCLAVILVGEDPASKVYVEMKGRACREAGIISREHVLPATTSMETLLDLIDRLNDDPDVHGILVQLPIPKHLDEFRVIERIDPAKDVDGFHPINVGKLVIGLDDVLVPCTPAGCQELIVRTVPDLAGKHLVVVGRSTIVGKPMANLMYQKNSRANCTVTICHTGSASMADHTRHADILVVAAGRPEMITGDMVKEGAVVIDVGINRVDDSSAPRGYRLLGDVHYESVFPKASAITPVPGGVGPMTIAMLMKNTCLAWKRQAGIQ